MSTLIELTDNGNGWLVFTSCAGPAPRLFVNADGIYLTDVQVAELHTALGEWLASTAPEPEAAPEPVAPELIVGRRYQVGPNPTFVYHGERQANSYLPGGAVVELSGDASAEGNATVTTSSGSTSSIDPRHLTLLPEDEPTDRDVERDAQVAELARAVAECRLRLDVLDVDTAKALTNTHGRIDRLAARLNQLESDAARPSPLHQAIADEIRRAAGAR